MISDVESKVYVTDRDIQFLNESNKIENIYNIDYRSPYHQIVNQGHFGAFVASQKSAKNREPLTARMIESWQSMIAQEQVSYGHSLIKKAIGNFRSSTFPVNVIVGKHIAPDCLEVPELMENLIDRINSSLREVSKHENCGYFCEFLGTSFHKFEWIHPFLDGNGRTGRLIANYINTFVEKPIMVFDSEEVLRQKYFDAHAAPEKMCCFMAGKIKEAVYLEGGSLMLKDVEIDDNKTKYKSQDGKQEIIMDWRPLNEAVCNWNKAGFCADTR